MTGTLPANIRRRRKPRNGASQKKGRLVWGRPFSFAEHLRPAGDGRIRRTQAACSLASAGSARARSPIRWQMAKERSARFIV